MHAGVGPGMPRYVSMRAVLFVCRLDVCVCACVCVKCVHAYPMYMYACLLDSAHRASW